MEGSYTGRAGPSHAIDVVKDANVPNSKLGSRVIMLTRYIPPIATSGVQYFAGPYGNMLFLGSDNSTNLDGDFPLLTPSEMWSIDTKMYDGKPAYGNVISYTQSYRAECASSDVSATAEYQLTNTAEGCTFMFRLDN